jgi:hypothetical protein
MRIKSESNNKKKPNKQATKTFTKTKKVNSFNSWDFVSEHTLKSTLKQL